MSEIISAYEDIKNFTRIMLCDCTFFVSHESHMGNMCERKLKYILRCKIKCHLIKL